MKWNAKFTKVDYPEGATRLKRVFAWLPVYIDGEYVWFEMYDILQGFIFESHKLIIDDIETVVINKYWKNKAKRCK